MAVGEPGKPISRENDIGPIRGGIRAALIPSLRDSGCAIRAGHDLGLVTERLRHQRAIISAACLRSLRR